MNSYSYRLESCMIPITAHQSRRVWFLDVVWTDDNGNRTSKNVCNGSLVYCLRTKEKLETRNKLN